MSSDITSFKVKIAEIKSKLSAIESSKLNTIAAKNSLEEKLNEIEGPIQKIEADIKPLLDSRIDVEGNLSKLREHFNDLNENIRANERRIHETDLSLEDFNKDIQKYKLERQGFISESAIFEEQLKNDNYEIQGLLDEITENMTEESLVEEISKIETQ